jgi:hypothetical protein
MAAGNCFLASRRLAEKGAGGINGYIPSDNALLFRTPHELAAVADPCQSQIPSRWEQSSIPGRATRGQTACRSTAGRTWRSWPSGSYSRVTNSHISFLPPPTDRNKSAVWVRLQSELRCDLGGAGHHSIGESSRRRSASLRFSVRREMPNARAVSLSDAPMNCRLSHFCQSRRTRGRP